MRLTPAIAFLAPDISAPGVGGAPRTRASAAALFAIALFLSAEPALRALATWAWPMPGLRDAFHADAVWVAIIALMAASVADTDTRERLARHRWLLVPGLLWVVAAVATSAAASLPAVAAARSLRWAIFLAAGLALLTALGREMRVVGQLLKGWCLGFIGYTLVIVMFVALDPVRDGFNWVWGFPGALNIRHLGFEAMTAALIGSLYRPEGLRAPSLWVLRTAGIFGWGVLFWSGGRGSLLALALAAALLFLAAKQPVQRRFGEIAGLAAIGFALASLHTPPDASFGVWRTAGVTEATIGTSDPTSGRTAIWREAIGLIADHPLLGIGEAQTKARLASAAGLFAQPHNLVLQAGLAWGVIGGAGFLVGVGYAFWRTFRRVWRSADIGSAAACGFVVATALLANSMIDGTLYHPRTVFLFILALCIALAGPLTSSKETRA